MELDPDMNELVVLCYGLLPYLNPEEGEELVRFISIGRQRTFPVYAELDDLIASVAISKFSSPIGPFNTGRV